MPALIQRLSTSRWGWRSRRPQSEICFKFHRRTLTKATGANGQHTEAGRRGWKRWIENTEWFNTRRESFFIRFHRPYLNN